MRRDSFFGERVLWTGRPKVVRVPSMYRVAAALCAAVSAISVASAVVVSTALDAPPGGMLAFAAWMATLGFACGYGPRWWNSELEFTVTQDHVVVRRGRLRRTLERGAISYARIHWDPTQPDVGNLELVRAVPTGALRRRLTLVLTGIVGPDRVWAAIRGVTPAAAAGNGQRLLSQRLDEGERVLWSAQPARSWRAWVVRGPRQIASVVGAALMLAAAVSTSSHGVHAVETLVREGFDPETSWFVALIASVALTIAVLTIAALGVVYSALVRPARLAVRTRYFVTNRRVLIQRGDEELHLERSRVVDVIRAPGPIGHEDLFLVLDGPRARALAPSGAFGEPVSSSLEPVLRQVGDPEAALEALQSRASVAPAH